MYLDPDSLPCDDFRKSWNHCTISQGREVSFLYRTGILLTPPLSPEDRPTGLVHLRTQKKKRMNTQVIHFSRGCKEQLFRFTGPIDVGRKRRWLSKCSNIYNVTPYRTQVSLGHSFDPPPPVGEVPFHSVPWVTQGNEYYVVFLFYLIKNPDRINSYKTFYPKSYYQ